MSFRPAPAPKRTRPAWERDDRRNLFINLGFVGAIALALLFLVGAAAASYYDDHYSTIASVNGTVVNKDTLRNRFKVDSWRIQRIASNVQNALSSGRITQEQADQQYQQLQSESAQLPGASLDALIDGILQEQLGAELGVTVSDAEIDSALTKEATSPELRHVWVIAVSPETSGGTATDAAKAAARKKIEGALAEVTAGKPWADVAKAVSQDSSAEKGGDLGWVSKDVGTDSFLEALFALETTGYTDVVEDADGTLRLGQVSEIEASQVDPNYQAAITDAEVPIEAYRAAIKAEILKIKLQEKVAADATEKESVQRRVSEILIQGQPGSPGSGEEAKSAHILFSPNGDPNAAGSVSSGDPAWAEAEKSANTAYALLQKDSSKFEELAKTLSNDTGSAVQGGELGWYSADQLDPGYSGALFAEGLTEGQILPPAKSSFGWHIIRFEGRRKGGADRIAEIRQQVVDGADFGGLALEESDASDKVASGDMGWVARYQLDQAKEDAIFAAPIGKVSDVLETSSGWYIFLVREEATRKPEGDQLLAIKANAFDNWYAAKKAEADIVEETLPDDLTG